MVKIELTPEQAQLLVGALTQGVDAYCDDRPEYNNGDGSYNGELRNQTYDAYEQLLTTVQTQVEAQGA